MKLVILDRDGVINEDSDHYIKSVEEWQPIPGSIEAIAQLTQLGYTVAVATNQSGIGRGFYSLDMLAAMHEKMNALVQAAGGTIAAIHYCPHHPEDDCECRKPRTGLVRQIEQTLNTSAQNAWFVGDTLKDIEVARRSGCRPVLVKTGKGMGTLDTLESLNTPHKHNPFEDVTVFADLHGFAAFLTEQSKGIM